MTEPPVDEWVWAQYLAANDLPADTPMPINIDAFRAKREDDGLTHCPKCGGVAFQAVVAFANDGEPVSALKPQICVGCGWSRQELWPPDGDS